MRFAYFLTFLCTIATLGAAKDFKSADAVQTVGALPTSADAVLFMSGFIERLTGKNDLVAINDCFKNGTDISRQIWTVVDDLMKKDKFDLEAAMAALIEMIQQVDQRLSTCSADIQPEITRIDAWIKQYTASELVIEMGKNIAANQMLILTLGATIPAYISAGEYFRVGETVADILQLVIGTIPKSIKSMKEAILF